ncbi:Protein of unknown function [Gryllus bimaculatus]|nr:Protein of unknown function [Gryllus bimaculatus]
MTPPPPPPPPPPPTATHRHRHRTTPAHRHHRAPPPPPPTTHHHTATTTTTPPPPRTTTTNPNHTTRAHASAASARYFPFPPGPPRRLAASTRRRRDAAGWGAGGVECTRVVYECRVAQWQGESRRPGSITTPTAADASLCGGGARGRLPFGPLALRASCSLGELLQLQILISFLPAKRCLEPRPLKDIHKVSKRVGLVLPLARRTSGTVRPLRGGSSPPRGAGGGDHGGSHRAAALPFCRLALPTQRRPARQSRSVVRRVPQRTVRSGKEAEAVAETRQLRGGIHEVCEVNSEWKVMECSGEPVGKQAANTARLLVLFEQERYTSSAWKTPGSSTVLGRLSFRTLPGCRPRPKSAAGLPHPWRLTALLQTPRRAAPATGLWGCEGGERRRGALEGARWPSGEGSGGGRGTPGRGAIPPAPTRLPLRPRALSPARRGVAKLPASRRAAPRRAVPCRVPASGTSQGAARGCRSVQGRQAAGQAGADASVTYESS